MRARDQSSIFSTGGKFCPDYGLLLELHALTLVARSYALLIELKQWYLNPLTNCKHSHNLLGSLTLALFPGHSQILCHNYGEKSRFYLTAMEKNWLR